LRWEKPNALRMHHRNVFGRGVPFGLLGDAVTSRV
jgi:hypothetical protein